MSTCCFTVPPPTKHGSQRNPNILHVWMAIVALSVDAFVFRLFGNFLLMAGVQQLMRKKYRTRDIIRQSCVNCVVSS